MSARAVTIAGLLLILAFGSFLRLYHLDANSLWYDEALVSQPNHPLQNLPFYFLVAEVFRQFGDGEFLLRFPSALAGIVTIAVVYLIGRSCFNARVALFSSLIIGLSSFHIYYSQEARPYSLFMLLGLASTYCLIKAMDDSRRAWWVGYALLAALGLYTHLWMAFVLLVQNLFLLWQWRERRVGMRTWLLSQAGVLLLFSPWLSRYAVFYFELFQGTSTEFSTTDRVLWMPAPTIHLVARILAEFFYKCFDVSFVLPGVPPDALMMGVIKFITDRPLRWFYLLLIPLGLFSRWKRKEERTYALFFAMYLAVPLAAMYVISFKTPMLTSRYASFTFPAFCILLALGIDAFRSNKVKMLLLAGIFVVSGVSLANYYFNPDYQKEQWRDVAGYVQQQEQPGDLILFNASYVQIAFDYYHNGRTAKAGLPREFDATEDEVWARLQPVIRGHEQVWLILAHDFGGGEVYRQALAKYCLTIEEKGFRGIQVYRCENDAR